MPHAGYADSVMNDRPGFHLDISDRELPEPVTQAIEVTLPKPLFVFWCMIIHSSIFMHAFIHSSIHSSHTSKHCICNCCNTVLRVASQRSSRLIRYERRPTEVRRLAHEGLKATSHQIEPGEKMRMSPVALLDPAKKQIRTSQPSCLILTSSQAHRISIEERPAGHLSCSPK